MTDGICDDVLDVVEGIAGETVIELMQKENNMSQKDVTHWVIRCAEKHCR